MLASTSSSLPATVRFLLGLSLSLAVCFGVQALVYYKIDGGTGKSESNYFSTLSRFQAASNPPAKIALAGSSITGRLPGRESGNKDIANLGSDGGTAFDGLQLLGMGQIDLPQWLVIETNKMFGSVGYYDSPIVRGAQRPWFEVGGRFPLLGASARPSGMLYAKLLRRPKVLNAEPFVVLSKKIEPVKGKTTVSLTEEEVSRINDYVRLLEALHQRGVKILFATYPAGANSERENILMQTTFAELAMRFPVTHLDLETQIPRGELDFTDPVHLGPKSAAKILETITVFCNKVE